MRKWPSCWSPFEWLQCFILFSQTGFASGKIRKVLKSSGKIRTVLKSSGNLVIIWKTPHSFETVQKIGNDSEKYGWFWNIPENGKWSGNIQTFLTPSGKWEMIWKTSDDIETDRKMGNNLEKSGWFWNCLENGKWSGKIRTVYQVFSVIRVKKFPDEPKNFLLPRFLGLWMKMVHRTK